MDKAFAMQAQGADVIPPIPMQMPEWAQLPACNPRPWEGKIGFLGQAY